MKNNGKEYIYNNLRKEKRKGKERKSEIRVVVKLSAIYIYMYYKLRYYNNNNNNNFFSQGGMSSSSSQLSILLSKLFLVCMYVWSVCV